MYRDRIKSHNLQRYARAGPLTKDALQNNTFKQISGRLNGDWKQVSMF